MLSRFVVHGFLGLSVLVGGALLLDALTTTDEERVEAFLDEVMDASPDERIDTALGYANPARQPVQLESERYDGRAGSALSEHARSLLSDLDGDELALVQDAIHVEQDRALVAIRARTAEGFIDVQFRLRRHADDWYLSQVRVL